MKKVTSQALHTMNRTLGLAGSGAPVTELLDGELVQQLDANPYIRRGMTISNEGIYTTALRAIDLVGGVVTNVSTNPYRPAVGNINGYPAQVPESLDVWVLGAQVTSIAGGTPSTSALFVNYDARQQGIGVDSTGAAVISSIQEVIMFWDLSRNQGFRFMAQNRGGAPGTNVPLIRPFRLARGFGAPGTQLTFSSTSALAATWECQVLLGLFPAGLGQDVIG